MRAYRFRTLQIMPKANAFYAQSGGVTAVINATACGVIETARAHRGKIGKVFAGRNGIIGALTEELIDTVFFPASGSFFGVGTATVTLAVTTVDDQLEVCTFSISVKEFQPNTLDCVQM